MKERLFYAVFVIIFIFGCVAKDDEKFFDNSNVVDVSNDIIEIKTDILLGQSKVDIIGKYLLIKDLQALDKGLYLLDKNTFDYVAVTGTRGQDPGEIPNYGQLLTVEDAENGQIYAFDYGKLSLLKFSLDSVLSYENYLPQTILSLNSGGMVGRMEFYNDSIFLGRGVTIIENNTFRERMSKFNVRTGNIEAFGYENPELKTNKDTRAYFALSNAKDLYVNCYANQDLMTICKTEGTLLCNFYGSQWKSNKNYQKKFYKGTQFYKDKIIASYLVSKAVVQENYQRKGTLPSQFIVFDLEGNYLKTLETHHEISNFCIDEDNNRLIMYLDDEENPLCYFDLTKVLEQGSYPL